MKQAYVVKAGVVVNTIMLDDEIPPTDFGAMLGPEGVGIGWAFDGTDWTAPATPLASVDDLRAAKIEAIRLTADDLLFVGAPADDGMHVALDFYSRADLTAMASTAIAAAAGSIAWPDSYARGWIAIENVRIPLPTPADGLALASAVGNYYAAIVQHRRDLKDAALAARDEAALSAIDITAGWLVS